MLIYQQILLLSMQFFVDKLIFFCDRYILTYEQMYI